MAFIRASQGSGGATPTETVLWQNPSPTATFAAQTLTLNETIANYDYLKISIANWTNAPATVCTVFMSVEDFRKCTAVANSTCYFLGVSGLGSGGNYFRTWKYLTDTTIQISNAASSSNNYSIPLAIYGIKGNLG